MKKLRKATLLTVLGAVAYAIYLSVLGKLPSETMLTIWDKSLLQIPLSFSVSMWWFILLPFVILAFVNYCYSYEKIAGAEPRNEQSPNHYKHDARSGIFVVTCISILFPLGMIAIASIIEPLALAGILPNVSMEVFSPLSILITGIGLGIICYVGFGFWVTLGMSTFWNTLDYLEKGTFMRDVVQERYRITFATYAKSGLIKNLPFILGTTAGFAIRLTFIEIYQFIKSIVIFLIRVKKAMAKA